MDNESKECTMCDLQEDADRMGIPWEVVEHLLESGKEHVEHADLSTTRTSKKPTVSQSTTTIKFCDPKTVGVRSVKAELVKGTLQLTITTRTDVSEVYSAHDAIQAWLDSWTILKSSDEQLDT
jgi:hypothetical protein